MQLTPAEQRFILSSPVALAELMNYHDQNHSHAASVLEADDTPAWPPARWLEPKNLGHAIVSADPDIWPAEILNQFEPAMAKAHITNVTTPEPGTIGPVVATVELTPEYVAHLQAAADRDEADDLESREIARMSGGRVEPVAAWQDDQAASALVVAREARKLIALAEAHGMVVTIDTVALEPLAMGNYVMRPTVRAAR